MQLAPFFFGFIIRLIKNPTIVSKEKKKNNEKKPLDHTQRGIFHPDVRNKKTEIRE